MVNIVSYSAAYAIFNNGVFSHHEGRLYLFFFKVRAFSEELRGTA